MIVLSLSHRWKSSHRMTEILPQNGVVLLVLENTVVKFDLGVLQLQQTLEQLLADFFSDSRVFTRLSLAFNVILRRTRSTKCALRGRSWMVLSTCEASSPVSVSIFVDSVSLFVDVSLTPNGPVIMCHRRSVQTHEKHQA